MAIDLNQTSFTQPLFKFLRRQRENKRFVDGIEIAVTFFVIALFGLFAIRPTVLTISSLIGENKAKTESIIVMKKKINNIVKAQDNFVKIQDDFPLIERSLPSYANYGDVATQIEGTASKTGFALENINYNLRKTDSTKKTTAKTETFSIVSNSKNTFEVSSNFIDSLLKNQRLLDFSIINFTTPKQGEAGSDGKVGFSFTIDFLNFKNN